MYNIIIITAIIIIINPIRILRNFYGVMNRLHLIIGLIINFMAIIIVVVTVTIVITIGNSSY